MRQKFTRERIQRNYREVINHIPAVLPQQRNVRYITTLPHIIPSRVELRVIVCVQFDGSVNLAPHNTSHI